MPVRYAKLNSSVFGCTCVWYASMINVAPSSIAPSNISRRCVCMCLVVRDIIIMIVLADWRFLENSVVFESDVPCRFNSLLYF